MVSGSIARQTVTYRLSITSSYRNICHIRRKTDVWYIGVNRRGVGYATGTALLYQSHHHSSTW